MKKVRTVNLFFIALGAVAILASSGCDDLVVPNVLLGIREGTLTMTTGIVESFFENQFGLEPADGEAEHEEPEEEGGNDLFIHV